MCSSLAGIPPKNRKQPIGLEPHRTSWGTVGPVTPPPIWVRFGFLYWGFQKLAHRLAKIWGLLDFCWFKAVLRKMPVCCPDRGCLTLGVGRKSAKRSPIIGGRGHA